MKSINQKDALKLEMFVIILEGILEGDAPPAIDRGICDIRYICKLPDYLECRIYSFMRQWDYYSGHPSFPVPPVPEAMKLLNEKGRSYDPSSIYLEFPDAIWTGQYGAMRKDLCAYLIDCIEDIL